MKVYTNALCTVFMLPGLSTVCITQYLCSHYFQLEHCAIVTYGFVYICLDNMIVILSNGKAYVDFVYLQIRQLFGVIGYI